MSRLYNLKTFTLRMLLFCVINLHVNNSFQTADWEWVFSHRTQISLCKKVNLLIFASKLIFPNFHAANKGISQSCWLQGTKVMFVSHCGAEVYVTSAIFVLRRISGSGKLKTIKNYTISNKTNVPTRQKTTSATQQVLFFVISTCGEE